MEDFDDGRTEDDDAAIRRQADRDAEKAAATCSLPAYYHDANGASTRPCLRPPHHDGPCSVGMLSRRRVRGGGY